MVVQPDDKIVIAGFTNVNGTTRWALARVNSDGTTDLGFNQTDGFKNQYPSVYALTLDSNGKVLVGGYLASFAGTNRNGIVRLNADGTVDTTFNIGSGPDSSVNVVVPLVDGKILVGGWFHNFDGSPRAGLVRLNADGSVDQSFAVDLGTNRLTYVTRLAVSENGSIAAAGVLVTPSGDYSYFLARLQPDGAQDQGFRMSLSESGDIRALYYWNGILLVSGNLDAINGVERLLEDGSGD